VGWQYQSLMKVMDRGFAAGYVIGDGQFLAGSHPPLITSEEWEAYQRRRAATRWHKRKVPDPFLLDGLLHCACGNRMGTSHGSPSSKATYRCHGHRGANRKKTIIRDRVDPLIYGWVMKLASDSATAALASEAALSYAHARWHEARRLARQRRTDERDQVASLEAELARAERDSRFQEPTQLAQALYEDWGDLKLGEKSTKLRELIARVTLDTTYTTPVLAITTTWGTTERIAGFPRLPSRSPLSSSGPLSSRSPASSVLDPTQLLGTGEAAKLLGVSRTTVSQWRRLGLLPGSVPAGDGSFRHSLSDLRRVLSAPSRTRGKSHAALRAEIAAQVETASPVAHASPLPGDS
jgi:hypothetical protein